MPEQLCACWHKVHGQRARLNLLVLVPAELVKEKCSGPKSKDCPAACHSATSKWLRPFTRRRSVRLQDCKTKRQGKGCRSRTKRTEAKSPLLMESEQKRLARISGRRSQRCLRISTRIGTSSYCRTVNKSTFVCTRITCSYFLLQSHAYVGLYGLTT